MKSIFIFNPETDIVLGLDTDSYTPNKNIANFRKRLSLLPSLYAEKGDTVLIPDSVKDDEIVNLPFFDITNAKGLNILRWNDLKKISIFNDPPSPSIFKPWGWNKEMHRKLTALPVPETTLPSLSCIEKLRSLSHRSLTVDFFMYFDSFKDSVNASGITPPCYLSTMESVMNFIDAHGLFCLKAPWSSSGRGVIFSLHNKKEKILEWAGGVLKSQGGLMGEVFYQKRIDFASEWFVKDGTVVYCGLSLFQSDERGKYTGNRLLPQKEIKEYLKEESEWSDIYLIRQRDFIEKFISPYYSGPLGFDMLVTENGSINPCVEINLRQTMGNVAIEVEKQISETSQPDMAKMIKRYFPDGIFSVNKFFKYTDSRNNFILNIQDNNERQKNNKYYRERKCGVSS
ncbi:MAG: hypothetical protein K2H96_02195 [Muribaculaceae bacterium]|nr:hypothetical protein [Muribaculaceae bacterium]